MVIQHQDFIETTKSPIGHCDGIFGLAYKAISVNGANPPFYNMVDQKLVDEPIFAFYLGDTGNGDQDSILTFGGTNDSHFEGRVRQLSVIQKGYWEVQLDAIAFGNDSIEVDGIGAILDTGSSFIVLPSTIAQLL